jgi:hypothetical protein
VILISILSSGRANAASPQARASSVPGTTQLSQTAFIPVKSPIEANRIAACRILVFVRACLGKQVFDLGKCLAGLIGDNGVDLSTQVDGVAMDHNPAHPAGAVHPFDLGHVWPFSGLGDVGMPQLPGQSRH